MQTTDSTGRDLPRVITNFDQLPDSARVGIDVVRVLFARSRASIYRDVAAGRLPKPVKVGERSIRWIVGELRGFLQGKAA